MIESLVEQIEARFAELQQLIADPDVLGDRRRQAEVGREYRRKRWVRALMWPGLMLQNLTTREPDREQLAVAIAALEAVLAVENPEDVAAGADIEIVA